MPRLLSRSLLLAVILISSTVGAAAQSRCRVLDPTGTPLNVRTSPNGTITGTLRNGLLVSIIDAANDDRGRPWVLVAQFETGRRIGWVFREFIACF